VGTAAAIAAKNATTRIPIVMISAGDPVRAGLVASLGRSGGNITGFSMFYLEFFAKMTGLLRELLPTVQRIGVLLDSAQPMNEIMREDTERLYRSLGMQRIVVAVAAASELENAVAEAVRRGAQALTLTQEPMFHSNRVLLMRAALRHQLPTLVPERDYVEAGGLLSLAISFLAGFLGLRKVTDKIKEVIQKVRTTVDKAIDAAITWIVTKAKALFARLFAGGQPDDRTEDSG